MSSKTNIVKDALPGVDQVTFKFGDDGKLSFTYKGKERQVTKCCIWANGLHDLCICLSEDGNPTVNELAKTAKERVLWLPTHDLLSLNFDNPTGSPCSMIMEINDEMSKIVDKIVKYTGGGTKGPSYDMYGGKHYGES